MGFAIGIAIDTFYYKVLRKKQRLRRGTISELILIVECEEHQADSVKELLWHHASFGIARVRVEV